MAMVPHPSPYALVTLLYHDPATLKSRCSRRELPLALRRTSFLLSEGSRTSTPIVFYAQHQYSLEPEFQVTKAVRRPNAGNRAKPASEKENSLLSVRRVCHHPNGELTELHAAGLFVVKHVANNIGCQSTK